MQDFIFFFKIGWHHIIEWEALDHLAFIAALSAIYLLKDWKQVLILVTAFTIGHSLTLVLSVFDIIRFSSKWVEFLIPCTIVITAFTNLFQKSFTAKSIRINYFLALSFGLIHGMGFANALRIMLARDQSFGWDLLAFNLGLEAGQILVVVILLSFAAIILNRFKVNRREWVIFLSAAVFSIALQMALERIPWKY
ncbi:MAG: HupE/UreJ family protein [Bacteroidetes bacterium]|nr:HupE/UreJ family protein [Bacteroidota bacterium]MBS1631621.1 HupE/UreJ family protein [Bacteroidota bacterium]